MKLGIMQPYFFPYLGYWQLIQAVDLFIILDNVTFIKQGYIHRNEIISKTKQREPIHLSVQDTSSNRLICDHLLVPNDKWKTKLLQKIQSTYGRAPYFTKAFPIIESCILYPENNVARYLENQIRTIAHLLDIDTPIQLASTQGYPLDWKGETRIIKMCKSLQASTYVNASGGRSLYHPEHFRAEGIELKFIQTTPYEYPQFDAPFEPNLSIIDLLMFCHASTIKIALNQFELKA